MTSGRTRSPQRVLAIIRSPGRSISYIHYGRFGSVADIPPPKDLRSIRCAYAQKRNTYDNAPCVDEMFYIKVESDPVERVIDDISDYAAALHADLKRIAQDYPAVRIASTRCRRSRNASANLSARLRPDHRCRLSARPAPRLNASFCSRHPAHSIS